MMEAHLGRRLRRDELVHHINEDKLDNRISNLEIKTAATHGRDHHLKKSIAYRCVACDARFVPQKTKRGIRKSCSRACWIELLRSRRTMPKARPCQ